MSSEKSDTWRCSSYFNELQNEGKAKYKCKLTLTNGQLLPDPYGIVENWKSDAKLMPDVKNRKKGTKIFKHFQVKSLF